MHNLLVVLQILKSCAVSLFETLMDLSILSHS